MKTQVSDIV